jgi:hypothetical protein
MYCVCVCVIGIAKADWRDKSGIEHTDSIALCSITYVEAPADTYSTYASVDRERERGKEREKKKYEKEIFL